MSQTVTLELPDEMYVIVQQAAEARGQTPAGWIMTHLPVLLTVLDEKSRGPGTSISKEARQARFAQLSMAAGLEAEQQGLTEEQLEQEMELIKQRLYQEKYA